MKMVALIPARAGSKRCPGKNTRLLSGKPLIAWTIQAARHSNVFDRIIVSTDDPPTATIAANYGAEIQARPSIYATDDSPDIEWVRSLFACGSTLLQRGDVDAQAFAILRPTSPFRTADTIHRAFTQFQQQEVHSIRAVQPVKEHPGKMWLLDNGCLVPVIDAVHPDGTPWHSSPTQTLPPVYVQNASLEMAWTWVVKSFGTISGTKIAPFYTKGLEGFDVNTEEDFAEAERLMAMVMA